MLPDVVVNNSQMARVSSTPASTKETPDQSGPLTHLKAKCDQTDQTDQVLFFPVPIFVLTEICHLVPRLARLGLQRSSTGCQCVHLFRATDANGRFCDLFSNFERVVRFNGGGSCDIVPPKSLRIYWSTAVLGLDSWGWDLNKEILPGSRRSRLDRRPKFPSLSYYIDVWGGVGGSGRGGENCQIWRNEQRSLVRQEVTQTWVWTSPNQTNRSTTVVWASCGRIGQLRLYRLWFGTYDHSVPNWATESRYANVPLVSGEGASLSPLSPFPSSPAHFIFSPSDPRPARRLKQSLCGGEGLRFICRNVNSRRWIQLMWAVTYHLNLNFL